MTKAIIHIGANKAASTTLQRCLFSKSSGLIYVGEDSEDYSRHKDTILSLISDDDIHYEPQLAEALFAQKKAVCKEKTLLFSSEDIMTSRVPSLCSKRLVNLLPGAQILIIIRNQWTAIPSMYANHGAFLKNVPRRYWRRYVSFDEWMDYSTTFIKYSYLDSFFYHRILSLFEPLFGKRNINILFYEDFLTSPEQFIRQLCGILNIEENESLELLKSKHERKRNTMRRLNYHLLCDRFNGIDLVQNIPFPAIRGACLKYLDGGAPADNFMSDFWRNRIMELYKDDNKKLADDYGIDLAKYGYPLPV